MTWATKYVGLPFAEGGRGPAAYDCWGLVRQVLLAERGIEIEPFADIGTFDSAAVEQQVKAELARNDWIEVERPAARAFDVALMLVEHRKVLGVTIAPTVSHIGVVTAPGRLLHVEKETRAICDFFARPTLAWRLHSFHRHRSLA